ncbi:uncharacterized protein LOC135365849 [Ornithodoros turicata]|uniref:uncharacterized protein LOC135365849 n=1 Tax=Ornithodoros turicata TaxID=34597 RepID=UPI00313937F0
MLSAQNLGTAVVSLVAEKLADNHGYLLGVFSISLAACVLAIIGLMWYDRRHDGDLNRRHWRRVYIVFDTMHDSADTVMSEPVILVSLSRTTSDTDVRDQTEALLPDWSATKTSSEDSPSVAISERHLG